MLSSTLKITEIFYSLQGETRTAGLPTVFVRLTGCPLRCDYCDTSYAFQGGENQTLEHILQQVRRYPARYVTVTGGEPLAQANCLPLLTALCDLDLEVSLETSGALPIAEVDSRVVVVMDIKTPSSGESAHNRWDNLHHLKPTDQIKLVIGDRDDYDWAKQVISAHGLLDLVTDVLMSPNTDRLNPVLLAEWILKDSLGVRFQMQLHKLLWQDDRGR